MARHVSIVWIHVWFIHLSMGGRPPLAVCLALSRNLSLLTQISHAWPLWHGSPSVLRKIQRDLAVDDAKVTVNSRSASHLWAFFSLNEGNSTAMRGREFSDHGCLKLNQTSSTELGECCRQEIGGGKQDRKGTLIRGSDVENSNVNQRLETVWLSFSL